MNKLKLFAATLALAFFMVGITTVLPVETQPQPASAADSGKECVNDNSCTDPDRPSFDLWGNKFDAYGKLLSVGTCPYSDPISGQPNPYCDTYVPHTPTGCPYGDSIPLDSPKCAPPTAQATTPADIPPANSCWSGK